MTTHYLIPYPEPGLGAAWDYHDRRQLVEARRAEKMRRLSERKQGRGRGAMRSSWSAGVGRRRARGAALAVVPPTIGTVIVGPTTGPTWTDSPFVELPNQIVPGPGGAQLGALWDGHLEGLFGKIKKGLRKVAKKLKPVVKYAAIAAAAYYTGGAALALLKKKRAQAEVYGPPAPSDQPGIFQTITGALVPAITAAATPAAPGSVEYYDRLPPGYQPPGVYSPYASGWDPAGAGGPGESPFPYATYGTGYGADPTEAGILGGIDMKTILLVAGAGAAVLLLTRGGGRGRRR